MLFEFSLGIGALFTQGNSDQIVHEQSFVVPAQNAFVLETQDFNWNAVTVFSPDGSVPDIEYLSGEGEWILWHRDHAGDIQNESLLELLHFPDTRDHVVIRSPENTEIVAHFYNTIREGEWEMVSAFNPFASDGAEGQLELFAKKNNIQQPQFYSRVAWGADERIRLNNVIERLFTGRGTGLPSEIDDFPVRFKPKIIQSDLNGKPLHWPVAEMPEVYKMVIHHTGEYVDPQKEVRRDPKAIMRSIYYYHTITKGWGDVGYNYVIDKRGNIYEGRAGGPKAIGAHVAYHNAGSIGISLMGNFNVEEPTEAQMHSLILLLADHSKRFGIDPQGRSYYLDHLSNNIVGHRDVAAEGRGTACPGENLQSRLPYIRDKVVEYTRILKHGNRYKNTARTMLQKSVKAPQYNREKQGFTRPEKQAALSVQDRVKPSVFQRNGSGKINLEVTNDTSFSWPKGVAMKVSNVPEGVTIGKFKSTSTIRPGNKGVFVADVSVTSASNGQYSLIIEPEFLKSRINRVSYNRLAIDYPLQVSGDRRFLTKALNRNVSTKRFPRDTGKRFSLKSLQTSTISDPLQFGRSNPLKESLVSVPKTIEGVSTKIKLAAFDQRYATISADQQWYIFEGRKRLAVVRPREEVRFSLREESSGSFVTFALRGRSYKVDSLLLQSDGVFTIHNYDRGINRSVPFNRFRSDIRLYPDHKKLLVVNELPLEEYLYGLAEQTSSEPEEKRKAVLVLARSYAYVYSQPDRRKFKTNRYDLEDSPKTSQKYLGVDWEKYHSNQKDLVDATKGQVITHKGKPVIGPYFTQSAGHSSSAWKRQYPWAKARPLPYDEGLDPKGHGVGLSGNSSRVLAEKGYDYEQIIDYFFEGVEVERALQ